MLTVTIEGPVVEEGLAGVLLHEVVLLREDRRGQGQQRQARSPGREVHAGGVRAGCAGAYASLPTPERTVITRALRLISRAGRGPERKPGARKLAGGVRGPECGAKADEVLSDSE